MGIHLAAEGLKVEGFIGCHRSFKYSVKRIGLAGRSHSDSENTTSDIPDSVSPTSLFISSALGQF
jgi:hypothetical protein